MMRALVETVQSNCANIVNDKQHRQFHDQVLNVHDRFTYCIAGGVMLHCAVAAEPVLGTNVSLGSPKMGLNVA